MFFAGLSLFGVMGYSTDKFGHPSTALDATPTHKPFNIEKMRHLRVVKKYHKRRRGQRKKGPSGKFLGRKRIEDYPESKRTRQAKKGKKSMDSNLYSILSKEIAETTRKFWNAQPRRRKEWL